MYELDTLYSYNGHKPDSDIRDNSPDISAESNNFEAETQEKNKPNPLKNFLVVGAIFIVILVGAKNHKSWTVNIGIGNQEKEGEKIEQLASPSPANSPSLISGMDYYAELLPQLIENQRIELEMQNNRLIWLLKNNLLSDAKKAKGSQEEYLLKRMQIINRQWQEKIADRKYDFNSAIGLEEAILFIPRLQALILAYEEVTGQESELSKFKNGDKIPPNFAQLIANQKQIWEILENIRAGSPEAIMREEILEERILRKLEEKMKNQSQTKEESAP